MGAAASPASGDGTRCPGALRSAASAVFAFSIAASSGILAAEHGGKFPHADRLHGGKAPVEAARRERTDFVERARRDHAFEALLDAPVEDFPLDLQHERGRRLKRQQRRRRAWPAATPAATGQSPRRPREHGARAADRSGGSWRRTRGSRSSELGVQRGNAVALEPRRPVRADFRRYVGDRRQSFASAP